ncbi:unnamed protein product [Gordionus sp. m RMFG-2023]
MEHLKSSISNPETHRFSVSHVKIKLLEANHTSTKDNYPYQYSVIVNFKSPRGAKELRNKYHKFIYKVWRITYGNAGLMAIGETNGMITYDIKTHFKYSV